MSRADREPLVSVVLPAFNREEVVARAIDSVLGQTYSNLELIVVDDASTDHTPAAVEQVKDKRVSLVRHERNLGGAAARNTGIRRARGEFVAFQDSDDEWGETKLERQMSRFRTQPPLVGVVYSSFRRHWGQKMQLIPGDGVTTVEGNLHQALLADNFVTIQASVIRKACFEQCGLLDERLPRLQDWELFIRISREFEFRFVAEPLVDVYFSKLSISADERALTTGLRLVLEKHYDDFARGGSRLLAGHLLELGHRLCLQGDCTSGSQFMAQGVAVCPGLENRLKLLLARMGSPTYRLATKAYRRARGLTS